MTAMGKKSSRGRPISFDKGALLEKVMQQFWQRGYHDLSFNEIAKVTGLTRASLYNSFKNKDQLFLSALAHYNKNSPDVVLRHAPDGESVGQALRNTCERLYDLGEGNDLHPGCMMSNAIEELASSDVPAAEAIRQQAKDRLKMLEGFIVRALAQKELPPNTDVKLTAHLVATFLYGLNSYVKSGVSKGDLRALYQAFFVQIGFQQPAR